MEERESRHRAGIAILQKSASMRQGAGSTARSVVLARDRRRRAGDRTRESEYLSVDCIHEVSPFAAMAPVKNRPIQTKSRMPWFFLR